VILKPYIEEILEDKSGVLGKRRDSERDTRLSAEFHELHTDKENEDMKEEEDEEDISESPSKRIRRDNSLQDASTIIHD